MIQLDKPDQKLKETAVLRHCIILKTGIKSATVSASLAPGRTLGEGIYWKCKRIAKKSSGWHLSDIVVWDLQRDFAESSSNTSFCSYSCTVTYLSHPGCTIWEFPWSFSIHSCSTVPLAIARSKYFPTSGSPDKTLNIFFRDRDDPFDRDRDKEMAILIVEFANQKRKAGLNKSEAAFWGCCCTTETNFNWLPWPRFFGAMPIALGIGSRRLKARVTFWEIVVVGGPPVLFGPYTLLSFHPCMFLMSSKKGKARDYWYFDWTPMKKNAFWWKQCWISFILVCSYFFIDKCAKKLDCGWRKLALL